MSKRMANPAPTDLEIAQATLPVGVNEMAQPQCDDGSTGTNEINRGCRQDETEASQRIGIPDFARFQLKTGRFIVQEVFFNGLITNDKFCMTRTGCLPLNWSRRPLRLRIPATEETVYSASEESECGGSHETPVENLSEGAGVPRRAKPVGSGLSVGAGDSSLHRNGSDANKPGGAACE
jgi:hypothetical protein